MAVPFPPRRDDRQGERAPSGANVILSTAPRRAEFRAVIPTRRAEPRARCLAVDINPMRDAVNVERMPRLLQPNCYQVRFYPSRRRGCVARNLAVLSQGCSNALSGATSCAARRRCIVRPMSSMRASPAEYLSLKLRAHELLHDVPFYDVSVVDLPGGGAGRTVADIRALDSAAAPSRIASVLFGARHFLDASSAGTGSDAARRFSVTTPLELDRRDSEVTPGTPGWPHSS